MLWIINLSLKDQKVVYQHVIGDGIIKLPNKLSGVIHGILQLSIHHIDIITNVMESEITGVSSVCSTICSGADKKNKHQSSVSLALCEGNPLVASGFPSQRASNVERISMS